MAWSRRSGRCAEVCADHLADEGFATYDGSVPSTRLKVSGVDVFSAGDFAPATGCEDIVLRDAGRGVYKRIVLRDKKIAGAVLFGDAVDGGWYFDLCATAPTSRRSARRWCSARPTGGPSRAGP